MTTSSFWNFISAAEDEYSVYRKRIMAKFSLSAAETDIIMFLANNPGYDTAADFKGPPYTEIAGFGFCKITVRKGLADRYL